MDGNIHFTGTQGVGKTTLLRALLFFYNADKSHLGLRVQGQRNFDDFYLPSSDSYIVYEVSRGNEEPPFSIILFRHHNRGAYRFVDGPYAKEWIINEHGIAASEPASVRQRIQNLGIDSSNIIERYNQYLDILYGNRSSRLPKDVLKYYLLRSQQYQNIPRIIQNVFLNERVDADFIKNSIIKSIIGDEEEIAVDLDFFRTKLVNFSDELKDITLWTTPNRHGIVETQRDADKIIGISHDIKAHEFSIQEQCGMLKYARRKAGQDMPKLQSHIDSKQEAINATREKISNLQSKFDEEHGKNTGEIAILNNQIKEASRLKKHYQEIGIDNMLARAAKLPLLKRELHQKEKILLQLSTNYASISEKYAALRDRLNISKEQYVQTHREECNTAKERLNDRNAERLKRQAKLETEIREKANIRITEIDERINLHKELIHEQEILRVETSSSSPMKTDIKACMAIISKNEKKISELSRERLKEETRRNDIKNKLEIDCQRIDNDAAIRIKELEGEMSHIKSLRDEDLEILERLQGSLCEWLDQNIENWENSIGKVVDEKHVLYNQNLSPYITDRQSDSIFGVGLDLNTIDRDVRTPAKISEEISRKGREIKAIADKIIGLREENDRQIEEIGKEAHSKILTIQKEIDKISQNMSQCVKQTKEETLRLEKIKSEEKDKLAKIDAEFDEKIKELKLNLEADYADRKKAEGNLSRELRDIKKKIDEERNDDDIHLKSLLSATEEEIESYLKRHENELRKIDNEETLALKDSEADTEMLEVTNNEIEKIKNDIDFIDKERDIITIFQEHRRTLLDIVPQLIVKKKKLEESDSSLRQKYDDRKRKLESKKAEDTEAITALKSQLDKAKDSVGKADDFISTTACPSVFRDSNPISTDSDCVAIISTIQQLNGEIYRLRDSLKSSINEFRKRFSPANTFKFPLAFDTTEDYHNYADSLDEFVSNNKIKEFQQLTSDLYQTILSRAAADFSVLLGKESEISRIIKEINYDFEKKTFAGVIRSMELRLDKSALPIIIQLQNITEFWNRHQHELGEINLFSSEEHQDINKESIKYLRSLTDALTRTADLKKLPLEKTFSLKFKIQENDNVTDWMENIKAIGSEGTDILVKAIINILLISVFKKRAGQSCDFRIHCMMDEIGRLADENIQGILNFANERDIYIVNSSPKAHRPLSYRRLYMLTKDNDANTIVQPILSTREAELQ